MKTIKVAEATGPALDWLVAKCEGKDGVLHDDGITRCIVIAAPSGVYKGTYSPSINWAQGGPIIDRHNISVIRVYKDYPHPWLAAHGEFIYVNADTPLIAAMRCYAVSKLGETAEVPEELI